MPYKKYNISDDPNDGICPQCKESKVKRRSSHGTMPRCPACLAKNKSGRLRRQREARAAGNRLGHYNSAGVRYGSTQIACIYCGTAFFNKTRGSIYHVCSECRHTTHHQIKREAIKMYKREYYRNADNKKMFLARRLERMGLPRNWYDLQPKICGICGTADAGGRGRFSIDHDHTCCKKGCHKCVRGLLCNHCNTGLGMFLDNPEHLQAAIDWVTRHRTTQSNS